MLLMARPWHLGFCRIAHGSSRTLKRLTTQATISTIPGHTCQHCQIRQLRKDLSAPGWVMTLDAWLSNVVEDLWWPCLFHWCCPLIALVLSCNRLNSFIVQYSPSSLWKNGTYSSNALPFPVWRCTTGAANALAKNTPNTVISQLTSRRLVRNQQWG